MMNICSSVLGKSRSDTSLWCLASYNPALKEGCIHPTEWPKAELAIPAAAALGWYYFGFSKALLCSSLQIYDVAIRSSWVNYRGLW